MRRKFPSAASLKLADFLAQERFFDAMQRASFGDAAAGQPEWSAMMLKAALLERLEDRPVHGCTIDPEMSKVMIVEHQGHEIEAIG